MCLDIKEQVAPARGNMINHRFVLFLASFCSVHLQVSPTKEEEETSGRFRGFNSSITICLSSFLSITSILDALSCILFEIAVDMI